MGTKDGEITQLKAKIARVQEIFEAEDWEDVVRYARSNVKALAGLEENLREEKRLKINNDQKHKQKQHKLETTLGKFEKEAEDLKKDLEEKTQKFKKDLEAAKKAKPGEKLADGTIKPKDSWNPMNWSLPAKIVSGIASFCALCPILCWFVSSSSEAPQGAQALVESAKSNLFVWALPALGAIPFIGKWFASDSHDHSRYSASSDSAGRRSSGHHYHRKHKSSSNTMIWIIVAALFVFFVAAMMIMASYKKKGKKRIVMNKKPPVVIQAPAAPMAGQQALAFAKRYQNFKRQQRQALL